MRQKHIQTPSQVVTAIMNFFLWQQQQKEIKHKQVEIHKFVSVDSHGIKHNVHNT